MTSLTKICLHWTAGTNKPCYQDLDAYHYCIDKDGRIYEGKYKPEDNINCNDETYAKHCGGGNTGCIGLSVCGMFGFDLIKKQTKYTLKKKQIESLCCLTAYLSLKYEIPNNEKSIFTHYEFDRKRRNSNRKIDITYIHYLPNLSLGSIGTYLRQKIAWYREKLKLGKYKLIKKGSYYEFIFIH